MSNYSYNLIEPLLVNSQIEGSRIYCTFRTPSGDIIESFGKLGRPNSIEGKVRKQLTRTATRSARRIATRSVRSVLGGGMFGRMGSQIVRSMVSTDNVGDGGVSYGSAEKQAGILAAFEKVADRFNLDENSGEWREAAPMPTSAPPAGRKKIKIGHRAAKKEPKYSYSSDAAIAGSLFENQLKKAPVENGYDKEITARILTELANADGKISREERNFLGEIIPTEIGTINQLLERDPVSQIECEEVSEPVKETIFMLAWTVALSDFSIDREEVELLSEYAEMLGLSTDKQEDLIRAAKYNMLENVIDTSTVRAELFDLATKLELSNDAAERCLIDLKKRN
ncbi:MAG: putative tellurite resistance protein B-like protein [Saprospiraceae bacterium]|jgi:uncharacterized tellurite resistance protein B-like protein